MALLIAPVTVLVQAEGLGKEAVTITTPATEVRAGLAGVAELVHQALITVATAGLAEAAAVAETELMLGMVDMAEAAVVRIAHLPEPAVLRV